MPQIELARLQPKDCPAWDYSQHPKRKEWLAGRIAGLLVELRTGRIDTLATICDSRPIHGRLFQEMTPPKCSYYAGQYRGSSHRCLLNYHVRVPADPLVGEDPWMVAEGIAGLERLVRTAVKGLDEIVRLPAAMLGAQERVLYVVAAACRVFELFAFTRMLTAMGTQDVSSCGRSWEGTGIGPPSGPLNRAHLTRPTAN